MFEGKGKSVIGGVLLFVVGVALGYGGAYAQFSTLIEKAKDAFPPLSEVTMLSGVVKSVRGDAITFEAVPLNNPFEEFPLTRTVVIGENTRLFTEVRLSPEEFQAARAAYDVALADAQRRGVATTPGALPPFPLESQEVEISVDDVEQGDNISVTADHNIKTEARFDAVSVSIQHPQ